MHSPDYGLVFFAIWLTVNVTWLVSAYATVDVPQPRECAVLWIDLILTALARISLKMAAES